MTDTVVLYKSKYGSTMTYAGWIAEALKADIYKASIISVRKLKAYSTIIFGGGLYKNQLNGIKAIVRNFPKIEGKKIIIFSCGLTDPGIEVNRQRILEGLKEQVPEEILQKVKLFHLHGAIKYSKLSPFHRFVMKMLENMLKAKREEDLSIEEKNMVETLGKDHYFVDYDTIWPIVEYARGNEN